MKKGSIVFPNIWFIHHAVKIWHGPWTFCLDRFLDGIGDNRS